MEAASLPIKLDSRRLPAAIFALTVVLVAGLGVLPAACGSAETTATVTSATSTERAVSTIAAAVTTAQPVTTTTEAVTTTTSAATTTTEAPLVPMSTAAISQWKTEAIAFADRFYPWTDLDASFAQFANDATIYDPCPGDFTIEGKENIVVAHRAFLSYFPDLKVHRQGVYLSSGAAAYHIALEDVWPPWVPEPADHPPVNTVEVFKFKNGLVTSWEMFESAPTLEMVTFGVFAPGKGGPEHLQEIVDRYLGAWASGDTARIAALYHPDASFSDTMLGLQAQGADAIAELGEQRFGAGGPVTFKVIDLYAQTNGPYPPYDEKPNQGAIIGVGIHYHFTVSVEGKPATVESLTTFELGTRMGTYFDLDPNGLITREEVFYDADSFLVSGLVN